MDVLIDGLAFDNHTQRGIGRMFQTILPLVCDLDPSISVRLFTHNPGNPSLPTHASIQSTRILPLDRWLSPIQVWKSTRYFARNAALTLHTHQQQDAVWHSTFFTHPLGWQGPTVVTVYDLINVIFPQYFRGWGYDLFRRIQRRSIESADRVIAISETTARDIKEHLDIPAERILCVPNGVATLFRRLDTIDRQQLPTDKPYILYIGHRFHYKNFGLLAGAYCKWSHRADFDLVAVGSAWSSHERDIFQSAGVMNSVHTVSNAGDTQLVNLYNAAAAFAYPSLYEGFGLPLLEAMACGCPIVASRIPSSIEVAQDYPVYFEPTDIDGLLHALDQATHFQLTTEQRKLGNDVHKRYSWESTARGTLNAYYAAAGRTRG